MSTGDTLLTFKPHQNEPTSTNNATLDTRNSHLVLDFDASTNESAVFKDIIPQIYADGGLDVLIHYSMTSATSGDTDWDVSIERIGDQVLDVDSNSFATAISVDNTTVPATSGYVDVITVSLTSGAEMDSLTAGELFRVKVTRDAASDTAAGDAELHAIELRES